MIALFLAALTDPVLPPCPPSEWGGRIGAVSLIRGAQRGPLPTRSGRTPTPIILAEGDLLCGGELVVNRTGSGRNVIVTLPWGAEVTVAPGRSTPIPPPSLPTRLAMAFGHFDDVFATDWHEKGQTRGPGFAVPQMVEARAVRQWGPWLLAWSPTESGPGPWRVSIVNGPQSVVGRFNRAYARIDVGAHCPRGCVVEVRRADNGGLVQQLRIRIVEPDQAERPTWLDRFSGSRDEAAVLGNYLADRSGNPAWYYQGLSLMWQAACAYPAVYRDLTRYHVRVDDQRAPCVAGADNFQPEG